MAWGGRKYGTGGGNAGQGGGGGFKRNNNSGGFQNRNAGAKSRGQGRKFGSHQGGNDEFEFISSLFQSKSGNSFTLFLKPEHVEVLQSLKEGDLIGVNPSQKDEERLSFWVKRADNSGQDQGGDQGGEG